MKIRIQTLWSLSIPLLAAEVSAGQCTPRTKSSLATDSSSTTQSSTTSAASAVTAMDTTFIVDSTSSSDAALTTDTATSLHETSGPDAISTTEIASTTDILSISIALPTTDGASITENPAIGTTTADSPTSTETFSPAEPSAFTKFTAYEPDGSTHDATIWAAGNGFAMGWSDDFEVNPGRTLKIDPETRRLYVTTNDDSRVFWAYTTEVVSGTAPFAFATSDDITSDPYPLAYVTGTRGLDGLLTIGMENGAAIILGRASESTSFNILTKPVASGYVEVQLKIE